MRKWLERKTNRFGRRTARSFREFDKCRFVVRHDRLGRLPLFGTAHFEQDEQLGNILRIALEGDLPGSPAIVVSEREWNGFIVPDSDYGCDYCLFLAMEG